MVDMLRADGLVFLGQTITIIDNLLGNLQHEVIVATPLNDHLHVVMRVSRYLRNSRLVAVFKLVLHYRSLNADRALCLADLFFWLICTLFRVLASNIRTYSNISQAVLEYILQEHGDGEQATTVFNTEKNQ